MTALANLNFVELKLTAANHVVSVDDLALSPKMQMRSQMNHEVIEQYAEKIVEILDRHPIEVVAVTHANDEEVWYVVDGFHRVHAAMVANVDAIPASIMKGTWEEAVQYAMVANWENGMRPNAEDAKRSVGMLLEVAPDFGYDAKKVTPWLMEFGIPRTTANDNTKDIRASINTRREAKILELHDAGLSLSAIAGVVGGVKQSVKNCLDTVQKERAVKNGRPEEQDATPIASPDDIPWSDDDDNDSPFFDEDELDTTPAINPADAMQKALKEHEEERQAQANSATSKPAQSLSERLAQLLMASGVFENHGKDEVQEALLEVIAKMGDRPPKVTILKAA